MLTTTDRSQRASEHDQATYGTAMATDTAEWPSTPVPQPTKDLFNVFYKLADTKSDDVGRQMSENVFTPDAAMLVNKRKFQGKEGNSF